MKTVTMRTNYGNGQTTEVAIDNSTNFKKFNATFCQHKINVEVDLEINSITIGGVVLVGNEALLFKHFINQLK